MVNEIRKIEKMIGDGKKICQPSELKNRIAARRSVITKVDLKKNTKLSKEMVSIKRPAKGIEPKFFSSILGKKTRKNLKKEQPLKWNDIR